MDVNHYHLYLIFLNGITNMSSMFCGCNSLASLPNISKWNTSNVTSMSGIFFNCNSLSSLPNISNWNVSYCPYMNHMFDYTLNSLNYTINLN